MAFILILAIVVAVLLSLGAFLGGGIAVYRIYQDLRDMRADSDLNPKTSLTPYYSSPSNDDRWFYEYPFSEHTREQIFRETDGYLVPLLYQDGKYFILDCPDYYIDRSCPSNLLRYYTDITGEAMDLKLWRMPNVMNTRFNDTAVYGCSDNHPPASLGSKIAWMTLAGLALSFAICIFTGWLGHGVYVLAIETKEWVDSENPEQDELLYP